MSPGNVFPRSPPVRVYVAAPFSEWPLVRTVQAELRRRGAAVTEDWTKQVDLAPPGMTDADLTEEQAIEIGLADLRGVDEADALLFLTTETNTRGGWCELGFALGCRWANEMNRRGANEGASLDMVLRQKTDPRIAVCGVQRDKTVFTRFGRLFADWHDAIPYVLGE